MPQQESKELWYKSKFRPTEKVKLLTYFDGRGTSNYVLVISFVIQQLCYNNTVQKMKFSIEGFLGKGDQIHSLLWIWSRLQVPAFTEKIFNWKIHFYAV